MNSKFCTYSAVRRASRALTQAYDYALRPTGLRIGQFSVMQHIEECGEPSFAELTEALNMDRTTLTRNLKPLTSSNLVSIQPGRDRRERLVTLTEEGKAVLIRALPYWHKVNETFSKLYGTLQTNNLRDELTVAAAIGGELANRIRLQDAGLS